jgi:hypothetical protein
MATKEQWEIFKYIYEMEQVRNQKLIERGKVYLSLITLYIGAIGLKVEFWSSKLSTNSYMVSLFIILLLIFLISLCFSALALGIYSYESINDPKIIIDNYGSNVPKNEEFFNDRIIDVSVATNRNKNQNDKRSNMLKISSWIMVIGILAHMSIMIIVIY